MKYENRYQELDPILTHPIQVSRFNNPQIIHFNHSLATKLELSGESQEDLSYGKNHQGWAMAYSGHQFGHFNPTLGDGRAALIGYTSSNRQTFELQLKGSGRTPFSRGGDGKSEFGPAIREYLVSEYMGNLGIPTTRSLSLVLSGEEVYRENSRPGGLTTRVSQGHIRVGTFQYLHLHKRPDQIKQLMNMIFDHHFTATRRDPLSFWKEAATRQAKLVAQWMACGFIHGVMNTDNMSVIGETIDYGPCAFMDKFNWKKVFSSIDRHGRYAYNQQISVAKWNLLRLAETLVGQFQSSQEGLQCFENELTWLDTLFDQEYQRKMSEKIGLKNQYPLVKEFLDYLQEENLDFTLSFLELQSKQNNLPKTNSYLNFEKKWADQKRDFELMKWSNPSIMARNHHIQKAIDLSYQEDFSEIDRLYQLYQKPFANNISLKDKKEPELHEVIKKTYCGT